jgi:hypothetical protein
MEQRNQSTINRMPNNLNLSSRKKNYLTESSCYEIQKVLRKDYFNRLHKASLNNVINYINEDELPKQKNINIEEMEANPLKNAAKQIMFSNKIRKNNYNWIKKHPRKKNINENNVVKTYLLKNNEDFKNDINESNNNKKNTMFQVKKVCVDKYPIYYDINYIDETEKKFIKPYLSKDNIFYKDYIRNQKSKMPFNFIIG